MVGLVALVALLGGLAILIATENLPPTAVDENNPGSRILAGDYEHCERFRLNNLGVLNLGWTDYLRADLVELLTDMVNEASPRLSRPAAGMLESMLDDPETWYREQHKLGLYCSGMEGV